MARPRLLRTSVSGSLVRVTLDGWGVGHGATVQDAVEDLIGGMLASAVALRSGLRVSSEVPRLDREYLDFLWALGEVAEGGGDIRGFVFDAGADARR